MAARRRDDRDSALNGGLRCGSHRCGRALASCGGHFDQGLCRPGRGPAGVRARWRTDRQGPRPGHHAADRAATASSAGTGDRARDPATDLRADAAGHLDRTGRGGAGYWHREPAPVLAAPQRDPGDRGDPGCPGARGRHRGRRGRGGRRDGARSYPRLGDHDAGGAGAHRQARAARPGPGARMG
jgi:hypothetical protein